MTDIFPSGHYRTAEQYGVDFADEYPEAEILAELDLTLQALNGQGGEVRLSRHDLDIYHALHYGGLRAHVRFAISTMLSGDYVQLLKSDDIKEKLEPFHEAAESAVTNDGDVALNRPLPLGRFAIDWIPAGLELPEEFVDLFETTVPIEPIPARRPGPFLCPREEVELLFNGSTTIQTDFGAAVFNELAERNPSLVEKCLVNIDRKELSYPEDMITLHLAEIKANQGDSEQTFIGILSDSVLLAVEPSEAFDFRG